MPKNFFYNNHPLSENNDTKNSSQILGTNQKSVVDINILLNRVKLEEKNETKRKIIFFSFATLALSLFGTFIVIIK
tara:strand:+ start:212 stop:439 length:228 start_codon:yes stop_codon:yes gene_type:complete